MSPTTASYIFSPKPIWKDSKKSLRFKETCLKQDK